MTSQGCFPNSFSSSSGQSLNRNFFVYLTYLNFITERSTCIKSYKRKITVKNQQRWWKSISESSPVQAHCARSLEDLSPTLLWWRARVLKLPWHEPTNLRSVLHKWKARYAFIKTPRRTARTPFTLPFSPPKNRLSHSLSLSLSLPLSLITCALFSTESPLILASARPRNRNEHVNQHTSSPAR